MTVSITRATQNSCKIEYNIAKGFSEAAILRSKSSPRTNRLVSSSFTGPLFSPTSTSKCNILHIDKCPRYPSVNNTLNSPGTQSVTVPSKILTSENSLGSVVSSNFDLTIVSSFLSTGFCCFSVNVLWIPTSSVHFGKRS
ncbi:hypothetical protein HanXRQr2_Chr03g0123121 [Helianthus annuus]|uniref:Uncharacterized protein n=1 Tax=Helianthus annuus TaxID=4232 RepID=A0A9K3JJ38_HELAN|nr:hypothetical protein HanXRQr2_Chr03g0123121 [Helianthus annuus]KAJ0944705.1 hypothetical protein HanPSC8_Chr03g0119831 [Helianthus annuus]